MDMEELIAALAREREGTTDQRDLDLLAIFRAAAQEHEQADRLWLAGLSDDELAEEIRQRTSDNPLVEGNPAFAIAEGEDRWGPLADFLRPFPCSRRRHGSRLQRGARGPRRRIR